MRRQTEVQLITERVRAVGKLVGLEVRAKEIATATKGCSWTPPAILSKARLAMIFSFEKQYHIDLAELTTDHVARESDGGYVVMLPPVRGSLRLTDMRPYDIQDGRVLGLFDVVPMNAGAQEDLMERARDEASALFTENDARYSGEARTSIERQLRTLLGLFDVPVRFEWAGVVQEAEQRDATEAAIPALSSVSAG
ncbi:MAG: DUF4230 domain-containing protein [Planctomycetota bacterium]